MQSHILALLLAPALVSGHGALTIPQPRVCKQQNGCGGIEDYWSTPINFNCDECNENKRYPVNDPGSHPSGESLVCRLNNQAYGRVDVKTVTAGSTLDLRWDFEADHPGDGGLFVSYDATIANTQDMKFFKIANFPQTRQQNKKTVSVKLPAWLPSGRAIIRWDWYATHNWPWIEFYANCVDVVIVSTSEIQPAVIPSYKITSGSAAGSSYPAFNDENAWVNGQDDTWALQKAAWLGQRSDMPTNKGMQGPACVEGVTGNCCDISNYVPTEESGAGFPICQDVGYSGDAAWLSATTDPPTKSPTKAPLSPGQTSAPTSLSPTSPPTTLSPLSPGETRTPTSAANDSDGVKSDEDDDEKESDGDSEMSTGLLIAAVAGGAVGGAAVVLGSLALMRSRRAGQLKMGRDVENPIVAVRPPSSLPMTSLTSRAHYSYKAKRADELGFQEGDKVRLEIAPGHDPSEWMRGTDSRGQHGLVPSNYFDSKHVSLS